MKLFRARNVDTIIRDLTRMVEELGTAKETLLTEVDHEQSKIEAAEARMHAAIEEIGRASRISTKLGELIQ